MHNNLIRNQASTDFENMRKDCCPEGFEHQAGVDGRDARHDVRENDARDSERRRGMFTQFPIARHIDSTRAHLASWLGSRMLLKRIEVT